MYASVAQNIVKYLSLNMNHPIAGGDQKNHKYSEHTQSTSVVKINDTKHDNKATANVQNTWSHKAY